MREGAGAILLVEINQLECLLPVTLDISYRLGVIVKLSFNLCKRALSY